MITRSMSIWLDGLTVVKVEESAFTISIIPHTLAQTVLNGKQPGDQVNIEYDLLGKYIDRLLSFGRRGEEPAGQSGERLTMDFLSKHGFM